MIKKPLQKKVVLEADDEGKLLFLSGTEEGGLLIKLFARDGRTFVASKAITGVELRKKGVAVFVFAFCERTVASPAALDAIAVLQGVGFYTNLRLIISTANTLHWLYGMPVAPVTSETELHKLHPRANAFIEPQYSGEPNITTPKQL
ncbi:hypothetical protein COV04_04670 [Candidatus Uhrbacteria bacterium CG10_big_fil_rev_8_21_14_0_10_48_11]|uniref:Uncharacterized protein n=1 Tax=Candidatus Uhrbacteria bacterium CG10_big_fil_rev_8_21_14_0_10_48_11 TaxID=1975037 RepID=A0A2M8LDD7_9BACT|nr:MAG: hypothetical protein COV04_04670 [Candidatus Uhrbacteria bacterium CG10_big_fil_rev_8_21_14_0_10_48_11]